MYGLLGTSKREGESCRYLEDTGDEGGGGGCVG